MPLAGHAYNLALALEEPVPSAAAGLTFPSAVEAAISAGAGSDGRPLAPVNLGPPLVTGGDSMQNHIPDLPSLLPAWFPALQPADLEYEAEGGEYTWYEAAHLFTLERVSLCRIGCVGGYVAAITGVYRRYVAGELGPEEAGEERVTIRVEFDAAADLADHDQWAEGIRARLNREYPWRGLVGLETDPGLVVTADLSREGVIA